MASTITVHYLAAHVCVCSPQIIIVSFIDWLMAGEDVNDNNDIRLRSIWRCVRPQNYDPDQEQARATRKTSLLMCIYVCEAYLMIDIGYTSVKGMPAGYPIQPAVEYIYIYIAIRMMSWDSVHLP